MGKIKRGAVHNKGVSTTWDTNFSQIILVTVVCTPVMVRFIYCLGKLPSESKQPLLILTLLCL